MRMNFQDEPRQLDDHEIRVYEKRYRLPETPQILVHPSPTAKKGDFSCSVMSLSILLDYRPVDTSKHCFELSVFAEQFNEMLLRDFGYNIFKAVQNLPPDFGSEETKEGEKEKDKDNKRDRKTKTDDEEPKDKKAKKEEDSNVESNANDEKNSKTSPKDSDVSDKKSSDGDKDRKSGKERERERERDRDRRINRRDEDSDGDDYSIRSGDPKRRDRVKKITVDPDLLLSFVYFDQTHCGYIMTTHMEDLFYSLGLRLSRADIKSLKSLPRWLFYRCLTDQPKDEKSDANTKLAKIDGKLSSIAENEVTFPKGNVNCLPIFKNMIQNVDDFATAKELNNKNSEEDGAVKSSGPTMVLYKGCYVDVDKLADQLVRSEKAREKTEELLVDLRKNNAELKSSNNKAKDKIRDLEKDLKNCGRLLTDVEQNLSVTNVSLFII